MNLEDYRTLFMSVVLVSVLVAAFPGLGVVVPFPSGGERFSEFWLLGPMGMAEGYPFNVRAGEMQGPVFLGVGNHMGSSQYYMAYVKFRNQSQSLPNATVSEPSPLPPLYEFRFFLADGGVWERALSFAIEDAQFEGDSLLVDYLSINNVVFSVNASTKWSSEYRGSYFQLFFELWRYDSSSQHFHFDNRFVGIWLNMTG
ncbi:MAG: DUF1616 domain-containing protein [Candidatus Bathyarchaeia archaeon]